MASTEQDEEAGGAIMAATEQDGDDGASEQIEVETEQDGDDGAIHIGVTEQKVLSTLIP